jgi:hypothetical protein
MGTPEKGAGFPNTLQRVFLGFPTPSTETLATEKTCGCPVTPWG